ncbi:hypothetical protein C2R22_20905 [Salinigranum rubrum]|uniref:PAS domain-containing protein n=1 Tax=Salinigranum rubrum TaxID=755307 RepID=A0A2I8VPD1_9EURY|nr:hypothetical protein C2R22_20905 [Salinigranum rubrum]
MAVDHSLTVNRSLVYWRDDEGSREDSQRTQFQFELLVENIDECAVFVLDENGHIRTWNAGAETLSGYTADEVVGEHLSTLSRESDVAAGAPDRLLQEAETKERVTDEGWRVRKDGSEFWADVTLTTLREQDTHVGYAVTMCDCTRDRRERILLEQNRQLKSHIAALSHDLNNPLNVAGGTSSWLSKPATSHTSKRPCRRSTGRQNCLTTSRRWRGRRRKPSTPNRPTSAR